MRSARVLGIPIDPITSEDLLRIVHQSAISRRGEIILPVNAHFFNLAVTLDWLREFAESPGVHVVADGKGAMLASAMMGGRLPEQIRFAEWVYRLFQTALKNGLSLFFLGGNDPTVRRAEEEITRRYPGLKIVGTHNGYLSTSDEGSLLRLINRTRVDILLLGMSMPVEERWILQHRQDLDVGAIVLGSGCFEWLAGNAKVAPAWISRFYFEWLFRLFQEPRRLWQRYLVGNPLFLGRVLKEFLRERARLPGIGNRRTVA
jgi:N-acetylglucosaminyldiphosphoundecaprenol N-acetyl-beta-D-mannosaminyltransferase